MQSFNEKDNNLTLNNSFIKELNSIVEKNWLKWIDIMKESNAEISITDLVLKKKFDNVLKNMSLTNEKMIIFSKVSNEILKQNIRESTIMPFEVMNYAILVSVFKERLLSKTQEDQKIITTCISELEVSWTSYNKKAELLLNDKILLTLKNVAKKQNMKVHALYSCLLDELTFTTVNDIAIRKALKIINSYDDNSIKTPDLKSLKEIYDYYYLQYEGLINQCGLTFEKDNYKNSFEENLFKISEIFVILPKIENLELSNEEKAEILCIANNYKLPLLNRLNKLNIKVNQIYQKYQENINNDNIIKVDFSKER